MLSPPGETYTIIGVIEVVNKRAQSHAVFFGELFVVLGFELVEQTSGVYCLSHLVRSDLTSDIP